MANPSCFVLSCTCEARDCIYRYFKTIIVSNVIFDSRKNSETNLDSSCWETDPYISSPDIQTPIYNRGRGRGRGGGRGRGRGGGRGSGNSSEIHSPNGSEGGSPVRTYHEMMRNAAGNTPDNPSPPSIHTSSPNTTRTTPSSPPNTRANSPVMWGINKGSSLHLWIPPFKPK